MPMPCRKYIKVLLRLRYKVKSHLYAPICSLLGLVSSVFIVEGVKRVSHHSVNHSHIHTFNLKGARSLSLFSAHHMSPSDHNITLLKNHWWFLYVWRKKSHIFVFKTLHSLVPGYLFGKCFAHPSILWCFELPFFPNQMSNDRFRIFPSSHIFL